MTNKEAAGLLGCSVATARRWSCARCGQDYLSIAHRRCGTVYGPEKCNTDELVRKFKDRRQPSGDSIDRRVEAVNTLLSDSATGENDE